MTNEQQLLLAALAATAAGFINALAGGGTLITFPALVAIGLNPIAANATSTVALCPGYLGGTLAQRADLRGQAARLWICLPAAVLGGGLGGVLLLGTDERLFHSLVPFLLLLASGLLALQPSLRRWLTRRAAINPQKNNRGVPRAMTHAFSVSSPPWTSAGSARLAPPSKLGLSLAVGLVCIYGGYFGAGLGVLTLAVLGLLLEESLTRLNALKQMVSLGANLAAAGLFVATGAFEERTALVMALGALAGGAAGGRMASRLSPDTLRWLMVGLGALLGLYKLLRG